MCFFSVGVCVCVKLNNVCVLYTFYPPYTLLPSSHISLSYIIEHLETGVNVEVTLKCVFFTFFSLLSFSKLFSDFVRDPNYTHTHTNWQCVCVSGRDCWQCVSMCVCHTIRAQRVFRTVWFELDTLCRKGVASFGHLCLGLCVCVCVRA